MNTVTQLEHNQVSQNSRRNVLTFSEAWDEVFEKAISKDKLYAEVRAGRIPHAKIGSKILFRRDTLEAWFKQQESLNVTYSN
ncbi:excisionase family DNA binding protein [Paenibacillus taihuensis]|uniref:Excisionase family DNA binding protein n=1 Tax=Paenibacillus taihuensis TaxID=1156355 RepID=A0A3D9SG71_9BACL|nr:helix-turn-helix domain-containing protein [Paenibacillus taihuensis]REE90618.1 excisionase family DNA binding protein [Paenibacillus taihuensis]